MAFLLAQSDGGAICMLLALAGLYFVPSIVAGCRGHHNGASIFVLNFFLGWTLVGWVVALAWSFTSPPPRA